MFLDFGLFLDAVLFVVGAYWCYEMFGRWSTDGDQVLRMQPATRALKRSRQDAGGAVVAPPQRGSSTYCLPPQMTGRRFSRSRAASSMIRPTIQHPTG